RALHSFPTRRSSDLRAEERGLSNRVSHLRRLNEKPLGFSPSGVSLLPHVLLVNQNLCVPVGVCVEPGSILCLHIDTTVAAIEVPKTGTARISMWELGAGTKVLAPPCIVEEEATPVIKNRILDR